MPTWLIWVIVIVVIVVIVAAIVAMARKRRNAQRRERAEQLRQEATTHASGLTESQREAQEARAKADLARAEAERAQHRAAEAEQGHQVEQAAYEDKLREADRIDPEVDHKARDYEPDVWNDERSEGATAAPGATSTAPAEGPRADVTEPRTARHAASPEDTTVAQRTEDPEAEAAASADESRRDVRRDVP